MTTPPATKRRRDAWELWLLHHAAATCYHLEATTAQHAGHNEAATKLRWEADRHSGLAAHHKTRIRKDQAA